MEFNIDFFKFLLEFILTNIIYSKFWMSLKDF